VSRRRRRLESNPAWRQWLDTATGVAANRLSQARAEAALSAGQELEGEELRDYALPAFTVHPGVSDADGADPLTRRELQVAELVAEALTNQEIADRLQLSVRTVRTHLASIHLKLGVHSRTQVAVWSARRSSPQELPVGELPNA
jgi:DNA-binding NarL/FixJ family response regulator